jgi:subtilase family serine protease
VTTVTFEVRNLGTADSGSFDVLVEADPQLSVTKTVNVSGLAGGASQVFETPVSSESDCYDDLDCTVRVTVDSGQVVTESDETNNVRERTDEGVE